MICFQNYITWAFKWRINHVLIPFGSLSMMIFMCNSFWWFSPQSHWARWAQRNRFNSSLYSIVRGWVDAARQRQRDTSGPGVFLLFPPIYGINGNFMSYGQKYIFFQKFLSELTSTKVVGFPSLIVGRNGFPYIVINSLDTHSKKRWECEGTHYTSGVWLAHRDPTQDTLLCDVYLQKCKVRTCVIMSVQINLHMLYKGAISRPSKETLSPRR